jgi:hypothetical protein
MALREIVDRVASSETACRKVDAFFERRQDKSADIIAPLVDNARRRLPFYESKNAIFIIVIRQTTRLASAQN